MLYDMTEAGTDALGPVSPILFGAGPLTGTPFPMGGRYAATAQSPLTNTIFSSSCGGRLGVALPEFGTGAVIGLACEAAESGLSGWSEAGILTREKREQLHLP